jgi:AraC family transcriptional regulator
MILNSARADECGQCSEHGLQDEYHFARKFRETICCSPHDFFTARRIERAQRLLTNMLPISEIASSCGFADQSHLTRVFRRRVGATPRGIRIEGQA